MQKSRSNKLANDAPATPEAIKDKDSMFHGTVVAATDFDVAKDL